MVGKLCTRPALAVLALLALLGAGAARTRRLDPADVTIVTHLHPAAADSFGPHAVRVNQVWIMAEFSGCIDVICLNREGCRPPQAYADRHGFRLEVVRGVDDGAADRDARWSKVEILRNMLAGGSRGGAVLWMDSDAIFANFNFSVLTLAQQLVDEDMQIALCKDLSALKEVARQTCAPVCLNTGTIMIRETDWALSMLRMWWDAAVADFPSFLHGKDHEESVLAKLFADDVLVCGRYMEDLKGGGRVSTCTPSHRNLPSAIYVEP